MPSWTVRGDYSHFLQHDEQHEFFVTRFPVSPKKKTINSTGKIKGTIAYKMIGNNGFGYDPIFVPNGHNQTFGEMDPKLKMSIDHRFKAYLKVKKFFI